MFGNFITSNEFGLRLNKLRIKANYNTPRELALVMCGYPKDKKGLVDPESKMVDRKRRNISNWENGKCKPSVDEIALLCKLLNCDPEHLLYQDCVHPRKDTKTVMDITGLSESAVDALIGIYQYGRKADLWTLDFILNNEDSWRFFKGESEKIEGINLLLALGHYLSAKGESHTYLISVDDNSRFPYCKTEISAENYIMPGGHLAQRVSLDAVTDAIKALRKAAAAEKDE